MGGSPPTWSSIPLGDFCSLRAGIAFKPAIQGRAEGELPFIKVSDMSRPGNERHIISSGNWVSREDAIALKAKTFPPGTVVFAKIGEALRANRFRCLIRDTLIDNNMMGAIARSDAVLPTYLHSLLLCAGLSSHSAGSALPYLRAGDLKALHFSLPPLDEQRAIASVIGAFDDKIDSNRRLVLAQMATRALRFNHLCRGGGEREPLSAIASQVKAPVQPSETPSETFEQFSIPAFDAGADPDVCLGSSMASGKTRLPPDPVILFSKLNPRTPRIWNPVTSGAGTAVCSPEFLVLRPTGEATTHAWLDACLRHDERFYSEVLAGVTGTTGSRQRVKPADVLRATVPVHEAAQIQQWTAFAAPMMERESSLTRETRALVAIRNGLLPKVVSGKIRIPLSTNPEEQVGAAVEALNA